MDPSMNADATEPPMESLVKRHKAADRRRRIEMADRLRSIRLLKCLPTSRVAEAAGMDLSALCAIERGKRLAPWSTLGAIAEALGHEILFGLQSPKAGPLRGEELAA